MTKIKNLIYLFIFSGILLGLKFFIVDKVFLNFPKDADLWFTSGLLLIILGVFVSEKYFTRPLDVIVNIITLGIVLITMDTPSNFKLWTPLLMYGCFVGLLALVSFILFDEEKNQNSFSQRIARSTGIIARFLGSSRMLFSIIFLLSIFNYFIFSLAQNQNITPQQLTILLLIGFWALILLIEPIDLKLIQPLIDSMQKKNKKTIIGKVIKRISPNIITVENYPDSTALNAGDITFLDNINHSSKNANDHVLMYLYSEDTGDSKLSFFYSLNKKVEEISKEIYVFSPSEEEGQKISEKLQSIVLYKNRENLIGLIYAGSDIDIIKIRIIEGIDEKKLIKEGDLVSVNFYGSATKYQIINVETNFESVDGQSKQGLKIVTAQQIGNWKSDNNKFEDTAWVPEINSPVFLETTTKEIEIPNNNHYKVGVVPRSQYPIYIDLEESVNHHIAIIGKTGTGKSQMAAQIIEKMISAGHKVVVFEVDRKHKQSLSKYINEKLIEEQDSDKLDLSKAKKNIICVNWQITDRDKGSGTLNLSDIAADVIEKIIGYQTKNETQKVCIVMEEAYDFIPENNFGKQDFGQPKVSRISQMVLKCRKHNIGFLIITQRTALVTKTILYQCHTIIALQSFDETSKTFMSAYINQKYLESMSILPRYRAIVVGKGSSCDKPVIVDFFDEKLKKKNSS